MPMVCIKLTEKHTKKKRGMELIISLSFLISTDSLTTSFILAKISAFKWKACLKERMWLLAITLWK